MESCIYEGWVRHRRFDPVDHQFRYPLYMMYLDLSELDRVFQGRWFWSTKRAALARFRRKDHLGDEWQPLAESVRDFIRSVKECVPTGKICLLTSLRTFGYVFNPVSFYFCYDEGKELDCVVAEVNNTPWGERHCYLLNKEQFSAKGGAASHLLEKQFHVSPFMPMDIRYRWQLTSPGEAITIQIDNFRGDSQVFDVTMRMERKEIGTFNLASQLVRFPFAAQRVIQAIYWQAFKLWWKRTPFYPHPGTLKATQIPHE
jgi:uncharacterized protein